MKKTFILFFSLALLGGGCVQVKPIPSTSSVSDKPLIRDTVQDTAATVATSSIVSVDDWVIGGFKQESAQKIRAESVTCYAGACGLDGKKWSIGISVKESGPFLRYAGKRIDALVSGDPDCPTNVLQCNRIKNVRSVYP